MTTLRVRLGENYPRSVTLTDNGIPIDLTGATVTLVLYNADTGLLSASVSCTLSATPTDGVVTFNLATVTTAYAMYTAVWEYHNVLGVGKWPVVGEYGIWVC